MNEAKIKEQLTVDGMNIKTVFDLLQRTRTELKEAQTKIAALEQEVAATNQQMAQMRQTMYNFMPIGSTGPR